LAAEFSEANQGQTQGEFPEDEDEFGLEGSVYIDPSLMDSDKQSLSVASGSRKFDNASKKFHYEFSESQVDLSLGQVLPFVFEEETAEIIREISRLVELDLLNVPSL